MKISSSIQYQYFSTKRTYTLNIQNRLKINSVLRQFKARQLFHFPQLKKLKTQINDEKRIRNVNNKIC